MVVKTNALTEKGQVRPDVRKAVAAYVASNRSVFAEATQVEGKNSYVLPVTDAEGNTFYVNFDVTVSNKPANERAERKPAAKAEAEPVEIDVD